MCPSNVTEADASPHRSSHPLAAVRLRGRTLRGALPTSTRTSQVLSSCGDATARQCLLSKSTSSEAAAAVGDEMISGAIGDYPLEL